MSVREDACNAEPDMKIYRTTRGFYVYFFLVLCENKMPFPPTCESRSRRSVIGSSIGMPIISCQLGKRDIVDTGS